KTQPSNPAQNCGVTNPSGNATANVTNIQVTCVPVFTVGGNVSGLLGSGLVLLNNGTDTVTVSGTNNVPFTFPTPEASGAMYNVTIKTQPSNPPQVCTLANATGTVNSNVNTISVLCRQPTYTIGGTLIDLVNNHNVGNTLELLNNGGDNLFVTGDNTTFTFPTGVTANGAYNVSIFVDPTSQPQPCWIFFYTGIATANVSSVLVDCQHNDWTWRSGPNTAGTYGKLVLPPVQPDYGNFPGGRDYAAAWRDSAGRMWLFGGFGLELSGKNPPDLPGLMNDLWFFDGAGWLPANVPVTTTSAGVVINYPTPVDCPQCASSGDFNNFQS